MQLGYEWPNYWRRVRQFQAKLLKDGVTKVELGGKMWPLLYWYCVQFDGRVTVFKGTTVPEAEFVGMRDRPEVRKVERIRFVKNEWDDVLTHVGWGTPEVGTMTLKELTKLVRAGVAVGSMYRASVMKGDTRDSWKKPNSPVRKVRHVEVVYYGVVYRRTKRGWTYYHTL